MITTRIAGPLLTAGMVVAMSGCGPKIDRFDVVPVRACVGDSVQVSYVVRGTPALSVIRRGGPPSDTTTYTLTVHRNGKTAFGQKDVVTFWPSAATIVGFDTRPDGPDSIAAADTLSADRWGDSLPLNSAASLSGRDVRVTHAGHTVLLRADSSASPDVRGLPIAGSWILRAPLLPAESLGVPGHAPPAVLHLRLTVCPSRGNAP